MSGWSAPKVSPGETTFELDRFELVEGERYEVEGRWSGVRGRVFIRPELTLIEGGQSRRLLADMADKPWRAADGDTWTVAFPCPEAIEAAEVDLTVAPDITVAVKRGRARRTQAGKADAPKTPGSNGQRSRNPPVQTKPKAEPSGKRRGLGVQLAEAKAELEQISSERRQLSDRLDVSTRRATDAQAEHADAMRRAAAAREAVEHSRDEALSDLQRARSALEQTQSDLEQTRSELEQTRGDLEQTRSDLDRTRRDLEHANASLRELESERDSAVRAGIEVERELHATHAERENLLKDREQLTAEQDMLQVELKRLSTTADEIRAAHRQHPSQPMPSFLPPSASFVTSDPWSDLDGSGRRATLSDWRNRVIAIAALAAAVVVVLVLASTVL